ncbi:MAG: lipoprotein [Segetibacter sp.]|nr:lipoprotein [Segetibacter sp.]
MKKLLLILTLTANICIAQQPNIPRDTSFTVYSAYNKEKKKFPQIEIAEPKMPGGVLSKENIVFSSPGNRDLHLDVFYPQATSKKGYPGVILIFGGGWKSGDKSMSVAMAQQIAAKGYVAVAVEYRLSPEIQYPAAVHDVKAAIRFMRANAKDYNLDKSKIAVHGVSAGGQLAALVGTTNGNKKLEGNEGHLEQSSDVQAIIDIDGVLAFKHPESAEGQVAAEWLGGTYEQRPKIWEEASALTHVGKNTPPTLFINSSLPRFHAGRDDMIKKLNAHGIYSEVHTVPDTPHPFWLFHPWFQPTVDYTVRFLDKVFKKGKKRK